MQQVYYDEEHDKEVRAKLKEICVTKEQLAEILEESLDEEHPKHGLPLRVEVLRRPSKRSKRGRQIQK